VEKRQRRRQLKRGDPRMVGHLGPHPLDDLAHCRPRDVRAIHLDALAKLQQVR
jgi:hypothetical protein